jgi:hypothetical protein
MALRDHQGLELSSGRPASIERYAEAVQLLHGYYGNPLAIVDAVLAEDPEFLAGHALRAALMVTTSERRAVPELRRSVEAGEALIAHGRGNEREQAQIAAARAWLDGDFERATDRYNRIALEHPRDGLSLQIAHLCNFYLGRSTWLRDHVASALPHHARHEPLHGYLHGMLAFGLEECHEFERAQAAGTLALEHNPRDPWAVHAVAHCFEMQGRLEEGSAWLSEREGDWAPDNFFAVHNYWHLALFQLESGEVQRTLALYDERVRGSGSEVNLELVDASALLWRLMLAGADVRARFTALAEVWRRVDEHGYYGFNDWHALMAYAGAGQSAEVERVIRGLMASEEPRPPGHAEVLTACRGFAAFAAHDHRRAVDELFAVRPFAARFGGSHAQRDVLELTLIEAALRDGQHALARSLCEARRARKPHSPGPRVLLARLAVAPETRLTAAPGRSDAA